MTPTELTEMTIIAFGSSAAALAVVKHLSNLIHEMELRMATCDEDIALLQSEVDKNLELAQDIQAVITENTALVSDLKAQLATAVATAKPVDLTLLEQTIAKLGQNNTALEALVPVKAPAL